MQRVIKNIIFDIGMVLMDFSFEDCFRKHARDEEHLDKILQATVKNHVWNEFDRGEWSDEEILQGFIKKVPEVENELRAIFNDLEDIVVLRDYAVPWVQSLREKGFKVFVLSNMPERVFRVCGGKMKFLEHVDGAILSYSVKKVKPDREIYDLLLQKYDLSASECVFLDDRAENIETARKLGMRGILFTTKEKAEEELEILGI